MKRIPLLLATLAAVLIAVPGYSAEGPKRMKLRDGSGANCPNPTATGIRKQLKLRDGSGANCPNPTGARGAGDQKRDRKRDGSCLPI